MGLTVEATVPGTVLASGSRLGSHKIDVGAGVVVVVVVVGFGGRVEGAAASFSADPPRESVTEESAGADTASDGRLLGWTTRVGVVEGAGGGVVVGAGAVRREEEALAIGPVSSLTVCRASV